MIINITKQFFWSKIQKNLLFILLVFQFAACAKKETLTIESFKTQTGWGYTIAHKNKVLIKQSVIPVINDTKSFSSENDALKVGNLVVEKLNQHISPTVTKNDLILLKIKF
ncbi:DUF4907 domain-containing protein [Flavobacterium sp. JLP]|uniref:DUF4907 domain-containing protein n=1 Tax=unclassified Flavobacterium TaxID=196869 RepID=UPI00188A58E7|nr:MULTISPECIES: DUF4907 domain-containing protein [unclassified Flavobacterium]MBF4494725.1 DUF4907 domain-containing protein [Flavobacterium sp. MR2016-29]MBF4508548.1 DUF4907 domain-containing protein [Flavobacterium sp. JLP]